MTIVKITVLETSLKKDLADEYAVPNLEPCPVLKRGQVLASLNAKSTTRGNIAGFAREVLALSVRRCGAGQSGIYAM